MTPQQAEHLSKDLKQKIHNHTFVTVPDRERIIEGYEKELKEVGKYLEE